MIPPPPPYKCTALETTTIASLFVFVVLQTIHTTQAFNIPIPNLHHRASSSPIQVPTPIPLASKTCLNCICIDCSRVTDCKAYHFVESKHSQPHMSTDPNFSPRDGSPTIHVNIRNTRANANGSGDTDEEMSRLWSEHVEQTKIAEEKNVMNKDGKLMGEKTYDLSVKTTYEYDVVACEDYVKDVGCWVRNMPEEIRLANPDFIPS